MDLELLQAKEELGIECFNAHFRKVFGISCLDFVETIVINLPESCYANCEYCIDKELRKHSTNVNSFLEVCEKVLLEFPSAKNVSITGGTLKFLDFNKLIILIKRYLPNSFVIWNTNGIEVDENYKESISKIDYINLHRNSIDEYENRKVFQTNRNILSISKAKAIMGEKLFLRVTVDEHFDIEEFLEAKIPLYLNRLLPGTKSTNENFKKVMKKLNISDVEKKRRNVYITSEYENVPIRIYLGDKLANHVPNRKPTFLNVAIIHRSGIVCGSWYENDKVIFSPNIN